MRHKKIGEGYIIEAMQRIQKLHENFLYSVNTMSTVTSGQTQYKRAVEGGKNSTNTWGNLQNNFFPQSHIIVIRFL